MNKDFLKFFDLSFKKFLTKTSILVTLISFNISFATDAPSNTSSNGSPLGSPQNSASTIAKRRSSAFGRGFNAPAKIGTANQGLAISDNANPTAAPSPKSSDATPSLSAQSGGGASEGIEARGRKPSILSLPSFIKKEEVALPATPDSAPTVVGAVEASSQGSIKTSPKASSVISRERAAEHRRMIEQTVGELREEKAKKLEEEAKRLVREGVKKLEIDTASTVDKSSSMIQPDADKNQDHSVAKISGPDVTSTSGPVTLPVSINIINSSEVLPESSVDVDTSSFYPTPKSRNTGSTTLVRRISSVIGDHLFTRSLSQASAAGDAGSEPVMFGFWGSVNSDNTVNRDPGSKRKTATFSQTLGFDIDLGDLLIGGAVSSSKGRLSYKDGEKEDDKIKTNTKVFTLYNTIDLRWGLFSKTFVSYGSTKLHSYVDNASSEARYKQKMWSGQTELGLNYKTSALNYVISGGVRYIHTDTPEHREYSFGHLTQTVKKDTADDFEFIGSIGVNKLIKRDGYDIIPHATFSARKRFAGQSPGTVYVRGDSPNEYSVSGQSDKKFYSQIALGTQVKYKLAILKVAAHCGFAKKYSNIGGTMMLRFEM